MRSVPLYPRTHKKCEKPLKSPSSSDPKKRREKPTLGIYVTSFSSYYDMMTATAAVALWGSIVRSPSSCQNIAPGFPTHTKKALTAPLSAMDGKPLCYFPHSKASCERTVRSHVFICTLHCPCFARRNRHTNMSHHQHRIYMVSHISAVSRDHTGLRKKRDSGIIYFMHALI